MFAAMATCGARARWGGNTVRAKRDAHGCWAGQRQGLDHQQQHRRPRTLSAWLSVGGMPPAPRSSAISAALSEASWRRGGAGNGGQTVRTRSTFPLPHAVAIRAAARGEQEGTLACASAQAVSSFQSICSSLQQGQERRGVVTLRARGRKKRRRAAHRPERVRRQHEENGVSSSALLGGEPVLAPVVLGEPVLILIVEVVLDKVRVVLAEARCRRGGAGIKIVSAKVDEWRRGPPARAAAGCPVGSSK